MIICNFIFANRLHQAFFIQYASVIFLQLLSCQLHVVVTMLLKWKTIIVPSCHSYNKTSKLKEYKLFLDYKGHKTKTAGS